MKCLKCGSTQITTIQYPTENRIDYHCRTCQDRLSLDNVTVSIAKPQSPRQKVKLQNRTAQIHQRKLPEQTLPKINSQKLVDRKRFSNLLRQLRNLVPSIDQSALNTCQEIYSQLKKLHQTLDLPEQTIQEINRYRQKFRDGRQKLIYRKRFCDLSAKAMNPNVETCFSLPKLDEDDLRLVEKWHNLRRNSLDRTSLIENENTDRTLGRLLSARAAEKVAMDFYQHYRKKLKDISITQIDENIESEWKKYDLDVDDTPIDVKNSRRSRNSPDRYTEHYIQKGFKRNKENQEVKIAGVLSRYLWPCTLLDPTQYDGDTTIQFLGETTHEKQQALKNEFKNSVDFEERNLTGRYFLPPWLFDYPEYVYKERDKARKELKDFTNLDSLKGAPFEVNLIPVSIAAGIDLTEILGNETLEEWEQHFLKQLRNRIKKYGLSLPFLFLTILTHFLDMAHSPKTSSDFELDRYRKFLFYKGAYKPLGIYDPLETIDALIKALSTLWTAENGLIRKFRMFKLSSFNILQGKSDSNELWTTLIAYCGGRLEDWSACGKNPLVLGKSEHCEYRRLTCPDCGFCCRTCKGDDQAEALENI